MRHIFFFATPSDIAPALRRFETNAPLKFIETEMLSTPNRAIYLASSEIPQPGIATYERGSGSKTYMVSHRDTKNHLHTFQADDGRRRWLLRNGDNEETVLLTLAGIWPKTGTLLPGNMNTLHETRVAQELMRWFVSALKKEQFTKVDLWWLGPEALAMLRAGKRLTTTAEQSPPEFDLKLPA